MKRYLLKARTILALGLPSVARVTWYRLGLRTGLNRVRKLRADTPGGPFFVGKAALADKLDLRNSLQWQDKAYLFGRATMAISNDPPDWFLNPITGRQYPASERVWWKIPDFDPEFGDIKTVWELSRWNWMPVFAQNVRRGDQDTLARLNRWVEDWFRANPPFRGPNWKCGQEASLRVINLAVAALILKETSSPTPALRQALAMHLQRIYPTLSYALGQDNNHGTSEAAALFIGGSWLESLGDPTARKWSVAGRKWLEDRAENLIGEQGSFSQYSVNYHRLMLDTFSIAEVWRRHLDLPDFSPLLRSRLQAAASWLRNLTDEGSGDAPNIGANDGAQILQLARSGYRDFRPSIQLAFALFHNQLAYSGLDTCDAMLGWLGVQRPPAQAPAVTDYLADDGGFAVIRRGRAAAILRYPRFRFRPGQADALHVDLWLDSVNVLRDGGTYSYNTDPELLDYFGGVRSHNTIQFDGRDQMPRLGRFLFGDWLMTSTLQAIQETSEATSVEAGYKDGAGASHRRRMELRDDGLIVTDHISGFGAKAVLRWRLVAGDWSLAGNSVSNGTRVITIASDAPIKRMEIVEGFESLYYLERSPLPVLEVEVDRAATLVTEVSWIR